MKKISVVLLILLIGLISIGAQGVKVDTVTLAKSDKFELEYPDFVSQRVGLDTLKLDYYPQRIVCLSTSALPVINELDVNLVAVTSTPMGLELKEKYNNLPKIFSGMSDLDTEAIIALKPDLVMLGTQHQKKFGKILEAAGIPVYYTQEGPVITYEQNKLQSLTYAKAFGGEEGVRKVNEIYSASEKKIKEFTDSIKTRYTAMVLFGPAVNMQATSKSFSGSIISKFPFDNLSDKAIGVEARIAPLSMELLVKLDPEVIFILSPTAPTAEVMQKGFDALRAKNPDLWNSLKAKDKIIALPGEFVRSTGMNVVNTLDHFVDILNENFGK